MRGWLSLRPPPAPVQRDHHRATVDPTQIPDPWVYADCLQASFIELREAAEQVAARPGAPGPGAAAPATSRAPLYVLPPQPADVIRAASVPAPAPIRDDWEATLLAARHPGP